MADRITDERLREIVVNGTYFGLDEGQAIAAELLAARNKIRADEEHLPTIASLTQDLHEAEQELATARADLAAAARVLPPCCGSLADAAQELVDERDEARAEVERLRARVAVLEWGLAQLVLEGEDAAFDPLQDRLQRCGIMPTQAALDAAKETN